MVPWLHLGEEHCDYCRDAVFSAAAAGAHPGVCLLVPHPARGPEAVEAAGEDDRSEFLVLGDVAGKLVLVALTESPNVELEPEGPEGRHEEPCFEGGEPLSLMVGDCRHMRADALEGVDETGSMLNRHSAEDICVVACPDLRAEEEHAGIEPSSSSRASLYPHVWELLIEVLEDLVDSNHVPMEHFSLFVRGAGIAVDFCQVAIHIPLHVLYVGAGQELSQLADDIRADILAREVKHELVATFTAALPPMLIQRPRWVLPIQPALHVDHLRLHPDTKLEPKGIDIMHESRKPSWKLPPVLEPVSQRGRSILPLSEPAVIQHNHLHPKFTRCPSQLHHLGMVDVEVHSLPGVQQHRRNGPEKALGNQVPAVEVVERVAHTFQSGVAVDHHTLRALERVSRREMPGERAGVDPSVHSRSSGLRHVRLDLEVPRVDDGEGPDLSDSLHHGPRSCRHGTEGIVLMAARSSQTFHHELPLHQLLQLHVPLICPAPTQSDEIPPAHGVKVNRRAH
mmetsp:Transcript_3741/g.9237  ORF Transcript_3741/g.9237 Transcript_3741/m.9237 type:complete len:509 (+) Transcript_3741:1422-2948(+)